VAIWKSLGVALLVAATAACGSSSGPAAERSFSLAAQPMARCVLAVEVPAWCGVLSVAENPAQPNGRRIDLRVAVVPAQSTPVASDPVFFLAGGPGGAASEDWKMASRIFPGIHFHRDIVLVDQRGTGGSHPLSFPEILPGELLTDYVNRALSSIDADLRYYTTSVAMDDVDAVRAALHYSKIDLYGGSYGATAAQYYVRQHPDHVRAVVLDGGTGLDVPIMELVAANSQRALDAVLDRCAADFDCHEAFPNVRQEFATVLARLDTYPVRTRGTDGQPLIVTHESFAGVIHAKLLGAADAAGIPWLIHRAALGDFGPVVEALGSVPSTPLQVMSVVIRCSEAWARYDPAEVRRTGAGSYYMSAQAAAAGSQALGCAYLPVGVAPPNDGAPLATSLPVLMLNGDADPQDPPANIAGTAALMPNSLLVAVPGQGHTVGHIGCLTGVVAEFFERGAVDPTFANQCVGTIQTPSFQLS
jgi:pimeloyl-ACP methyl ester carboxylesterase